jgi:hypothetical protein
MLTAHVCNICGLLFLFLLQFEHKVGRGSTCFVLLRLSYWSTSASKSSQLSRYPLHRPSALINVPRSKSSFQRPHLSQLLCLVYTCKSSFFSSAACLRLFYLQHPYSPTMSNLFEIKGKVLPRTDHKGPEGE